MVTELEDFACKYETDRWCRLTSIFIGKGFPVSTNITWSHTNTQTQQRRKKRIRNRSNERWEVEIKNTNSEDKKKFISFLPTSKVTYLLSCGHLCAQCTLISLQMEFFSVCFLRFFFTFFFCFLFLSLHSLLLFVFGVRWYYNIYKL